MTTYNVLQQVSFRRIRMFQDREAIETMLDGSTRCLCRQQGNSSNREELHGAVLQKNPSESLQQISHVSGAIARI